MSDTKYAYPLILNKVTHYALGSECGSAAPLQLDPGLVASLAKRVEVNLEVLEIVGEGTRRVDELIENLIDLIEQGFDVAEEASE